MVVAFLPFCFLFFSLERYTTPEGGCSGFSEWDSLISVIPEHSLTALTMLCVCVCVLCQHCHSLYLDDQTHQKKAFYVIVEYVFIFSQLFHF